MKTSDFFYELPEELIAQYGSQKRDQSRLLVLDRKSGSYEDRMFCDIAKYISPGDCLVINRTKVIPARLLGNKADCDDVGRSMEFLLLRRIDGDDWETLVKPGKRAKIGAEFIFGNELRAKVLSICDDGARIVRFYYNGIWEEVLDRVGIIPLPPYIKAPLADKDRYQTVYAREPGSAAAPTAGLHFTKELLAELEKKGVKIAEILLHVGVGTFRPVKVDDLDEHVMHSEYYEVSQEACDTINSCRESGGRVFCVGTTSCRTLETVADGEGTIHAGSGNTDIFIKPGYAFKAVDALITNFHLPESTLLMLISALAGREKILKAYEHAVEEKYRFFSFGDAMLIL